MMRSAANEVLRRRRQGASLEGPYPDDLGAAETDTNAIAADELLRRWFSRALKFHIVLSLAMYALLAAHITSGIYLGLRWLQ